MGGVTGSPSVPPTAVTAVPRRLRRACAATAFVVVVVMVVVGVLLKSSSTGTMSFKTSDQVAMIVLGLIIAAGLLALGRPRVDADAEGIRVRNVLGGYRFPWDFVRAVRFERSSAWASLALANGDEIALMAVQATDGERAVAAVEGLRALLAAAHGPVAPKPPLLYDD
jgi:cytochrome c biogenesis protein CcdA